MPEYYEIIRDIATFGGAVVAFVAGLKQYKKSQEWKRSEFASTYLDALWKDTKIRFCCLAIDWTKRRIETTEDYHCFYINNEEDGVIKHNTDLFEDALKTDKESQDFAWPKVYYRDCFDRFFDYLSMANHYIEIGLIKLDDLKPLTYWLEQINALKFHNNKDFLKKYYQFYGFEGVDKLIGKLKRHYD